MTTRPVEEKKYGSAYFSCTCHICCFKIFIHKVVPIQNAYVRKRGITQPKIYGLGSKVNHFIYILICNSMPNIGILALAVLQIFCSQSCPYIIEKGV